MTTQERRDRALRVLAAIVRRNGISELHRRPQLRAHLDYHERIVVRELVQSQHTR